MLDLTHVIAGPVGARLLAQFGADVLHLSRPDRPDPIPMIAMTGGGKRNAYCDLRDAHDRAAFHDALHDADVFVHSYRGLARHGASTEELVRRRPGLITLEYHAWGADGPWGERGGFDQLACSATGFAVEEWTDRPSLPPTYLLNDYLAAYLGAAAVATVLRSTRDPGRLMADPRDPGRGVPLGTGTRTAGTGERHRPAPPRTHTPRRAVDHRHRLRPAHRTGDTVRLQRAPRPPARPAFPTRLRPAPVALSTPRKCRTPSASRPGAGRTPRRNRISTPPIPSKHDPVTHHPVHPPHPTTQEAPEDVRQAERPAQPGTPRRSPRRRTGQRDHGSVRSTTARRLGRGRDQGRAAHR
ncbi:CoA transferase [Streptomyces lasalocidi]